MDYWEWNKTLSIACALYRKINLKENYAMTLDLSRKTRDYLYGRLLALAENLEEWALNKAHEDRETNAARLMQRFAERPYSTWRTIELALTPSKARLGGKSKKRQRMIDEVIASFDGNDFLNDKRLSGEFLLGYHCQREYLRALTNTNKEPDDEND
jgi:CRISPR-associated protein Csd1